MRHGAFITEIDLFDNAAFGVGVAESSTMDPQQRLLLSHGYSALHGGGLTRSMLMEANVGVLVGIMSNEFSSALEFSNAYAMTGTGHCFASGRLSFMLGMQGECATFDTACSSALVAFNSGRRSIQAGDVDVGALVAGVNLVFLPAQAYAYAAASLTSAAGASKVFDARADGFVRGEGVGAGFLSAEAALSEPAACGGAVRQDGKSASLTAPNGKAQQRLMQAVLAGSTATATEPTLVESASNGSYCAYASGGSCAP